MHIIKLQVTDKLEPSSKFDDKSPSPGNRFMLKYTKYELLLG